jgi:hypothetical protein
MNFPLGDLRGLVDAVGKLLGEPLAGDAHRLLRDAELVDALGVVEQLGRCWRRPG